MSQTTDEAEVDRAFVARMAERPLDFELRLVYADWREERGDASGAALLRLQVQRARTTSRWTSDGYDWEVTSAEARCDPAWVERVRPTSLPLHVCRDPVWLAAALGGEAERATLGGDAPPDLRELGYVSEPLLWGWPSEVLARLSIAGAKLAIDAAYPAGVEPPAEILQHLARVEAWLEARPGGAKGLPGAPSGFADPTLPLPPVEEGDRPRVRARVEVHLAVRAIERVLGAYQRGHESWTSVPGAAAHALAAAAGALHQRAWAERGLKRVHLALEHLEAHALAAQRRADEGVRRAASLRERVDAVGGDGPAAFDAARVENARRGALASAARRAADAARAAAPPAPKLEDAIRTVMRAAAPAVLAWICARDVIPTDEIAVGTVELHRGILYDYDACGRLERPWRWARP